MAKKVSPLDVYPYLPDDCETLFGEPKMKIAAHLAGRKIKIQEIKEIYDALPPEYASKFDALSELLKPAIAEIEIGVGPKKIVIGGDDVMFRHMLSFYNKPPIAADVWDTMTAAELSARLKKIQSFQKFYVGSYLYLNAVAVRSTSGNPAKFGKFVSSILKKCDLPLILCTKDPKIMREGLAAAAGKNPLMYACDVSNRAEMTKLALEFEVPITVSSKGDLEELKSLAATLLNDGVDKIVLDPGMPSSGLKIRETFQNFIRIRKAGIDGDSEIAFPIIALPIAARTNPPSSDVLNMPPEVISDYCETIAASSLIVRYADILIIHGLEAHELLPLVHAADMIYTDPRTPSSVEPKLYEIGTPDASSPVLFTTNFALTYYTVESDLMSAGFSGYLFAVNTGGLGVEAAVAGGQLTADVIKKEFERVSFNPAVQTDHKTLVLPGLAARLQSDIEKMMNVSAPVGPMDSGRLGKWLEENWPPKKK
jgi:CO dehydrogenase/acetyl-CoA synthase gamma subunit (corrinoid Fe-S protein)